MRLEKWALANKCGLILPQDYSKVRSYGFGATYKRKKYGFAITKSRVVKLTEKKLVTRFGRKYILGEMHPDYVSFIAAYEKGIPILKNWNFSNGMLHGTIFKDANYEDEEFSDDNHVFGKVIQQDMENNLCTLQTSKGELVVYVDWQAISFDMKVILDLLLEDVPSLLGYANRRIKPDILGAHKTMLEEF